MRVTKISPAVKTPGRYNIYVDGKYSFSLDEFQLVQTGLHSGLDIDESKLDELKSESDYGKNYIRAVDLISRRLRSEKEMRDYAKRKQWTATNTERVIERLKNHGYLNDKVFAEAFVRSRQSTERYSKRRIERDLRQKGIAPNIIKQVLPDKSNDKNAIIKLVQKKASRYDDVNKLKAYLIRAGFNYDDVNQAINEYYNNK